MKLSVLIDNLSTYVKAKYSVKGNLVLFGSSFGGLISTLFTFLYPTRITKLILMAPALGFSAQRLVKMHNIHLGRWKESGVIHVFHFRYDQEIPLGYSFYEDLLSNPPPKIKKLRIDVPTLILHGKSDDVVPLSWSQQFVEINPEATLHILNGDHQLLDQKEIMWNFVEDFLNRD